MEFKDFEKKWIQLRNDLTFVLNEFDSIKKAYEMQVKAKDQIVLELESLNKERTRIKLEIGNQKDAWSKQQEKEMDILNKKKEEIVSIFSQVEKEKAKAKELLAQAEAERRDVLLKINELNSSLKELENKKETFKKLSEVLGG